MQRLEIRAKLQAHTGRSARTKRSSENKIISPFIHPAAAAVAHSLFECIELVHVARESAKKYTFAHKYSCARRRRWRFGIFGSGPGHRPYQSKSTNMHAPSQAGRRRQQRLNDYCNEARRRSSPRERKSVHTKDDCDSL
jgi:hypothetical protein